MSRIQEIIRCAYTATIAVMSMAPLSFAQTIPGIGKTVPLTQYQVNSEYGTFNNLLIVGGNPFLATPTVVKTTIRAVAIPLVFQIIDENGKLWTFDPTQPNNCDYSQTAMDRFSNSPLVQKVKDLTFNGVDVGDFQYIAGYKRAEFWNAYNNGKNVEDTIEWEFASKVVFPPVLAPGLAVIVDPEEPCEVRAHVISGFISTQIKALLIPSLQAAGVISPTKFALFITRDVVESGNAPATATGGITGGAHGHVPSDYSESNPPQTFAWAQYDTTSFFIDGPTANHQDIHALSHEIGEWMMDPLNNNATPPWSNPESGSCATHLEVGDPIKDDYVNLTLNGYTYHPQELTFFSWYYNKAIHSIGAGQKFSSNGSLTTPHDPCK